MLLMALGVAFLQAQDTAPAEPDAEKIEAASQPVGFSEAQTEQEVAAAAGSVEQSVSEGESVQLTTIEEAVQTLDKQEEAATEQTPEETLPLIEPERLPDDARQFLPDDSLLMDAPGYIPSYDEIVEKSRKVLRSVAEPGLEMRQNVAIRKARTKALADPEVRAALENAQAQLYHAEKTEAWKAYYDILYKKMERADSKLAKKLQSMRAEDYQRLGLPVSSNASSE